jgi:methionyl-tRNA formyltransferase
MKAILVGAVESSRVALKCLADSAQWDLAAVFTLPPELAQRHSDFVDLYKDAAGAGTRIKHAADINAEESLREIHDISPDYIFVIGWSQICGERFRATAGKGVIGYHPAPLPRLRGRAAIPWTILLNEPISASSLFLIDEGVDNGPLLAQRYFHVAPDETAETLYTKHMQALGQMLPKLLEDMASGTHEPERQDERCATYAARRRPDDALIDWSLPASSIWRCVRACGHPYPGAWTTVGRDRVIIDAATPVPLTHHAAAMPGQIVERSNDSFIVRCGDGQGLRVSQWRSARTGPMPMHARLGRASLPA